MFDTDAYSRTIFARGDLEIIRPTTVRLAVVAAVKALEELNIGVVRDESDHHHGQVEARTPSDRRIIIKTQDLGGGATKITIRVGQLGDEQLSTTIYQKMRRHM